jgi:hypothetical protein
MNYRSFHIRVIAPLLLIGAAWAQESQISGVVQDSSGGRVPDAVISAVQVKLIGVLERIVHQGWHDHDHMRLKY